MPKIDDFLLMSKYTRTNEKIFYFILIFIKDKI